MVIERGYGGRNPIIIVIAVVIISCKELLSIVADISILK